MAKIFVSYSRKDKNEVYPIVEMLQQNGYECWIDKKRINSGEVFKQLIIEAINECDVFLYMMSENSVKSEWVKKEYCLAKRKDKKIIPVLLKGAEYCDEIMFDWADVDYIDASKSGWKKKILENLHRMLDEKEEISLLDSISTIDLLKTIFKLKSEGRLEMSDYYSLLESVKEINVKGNSEIEKINACISQVVEKFTDMLHHNKECEDEMSEKINANKMFLHELEEKGDPSAENFRKSLRIVEEHMLRSLENSKIEEQEMLVKLEELYNRHKMIMNFIEENKRELWKQLLNCKKDPAQDVSMV